MTDRPNILFIFSDQQQRFALGCMDNPDVLTPNLDALAKNGALFTQAYTCCPICTAARINFVTGMYSSQTDSIGNCAAIPENVTTFASAFKSGGYRTAFVGKWHIGAGGNDRIPRELMGGFDEFSGYQCYNGFLNEIRFWDENGRMRQFDRHRTDVTTDVAIEKLESFGDRPFAMMVGYQAPHYPEEPSQKYAELYRDRTVSPRTNVQDGVEPYIQTYSPPSPKPFENDPNFRRYGGNMDEYRKLYSAMITQIDANVGRLLTRLEQLGLADNTAVIFTSDHGDMQGSHGMVNKCLPHEESAGIPLIVRVPGGVRGLVTGSLVSGVDYMPTCLELAGLPVPAGVSGRSFAPLLRGERQDLSGPVFSEFHDWRMIRRDNWKLVVDRDDNPARLYDMKSDPYEMNNFVESEEHSETIRQLRKEILDWRERCRRGDTVCANE